MGKIGLTDLQQNIFRLGNQNVGKMPSTRECASQITTVNFGGTFAMKKNDNDDKNPTEGQALILTMVMLIGVTLLLNGCANLFMRIM